jgi:uncharacterized protein (UPF0262 family)
MKKLLFTFCLFVAFASNTKAQTKEATITWLQEKLQKYAYGDGWGSKFEDLSVKVSECAITFRFTLKDSKGTWTDQYYIIPTTGVIFDKYFLSMKDRIKSIKMKYASDNEILESGTRILITKGEENLYERLQKAVDHLATFCPKKQETF